MAEQDKYGSHFNANPSNPVKDSSSTSLLNIGSWFRSSEDNPVKKAASKINSSDLGSGAEQDRYSSHFELASRNPVKQAASMVKDSSFGRGTSTSEQDRYASHFSLNPNNPIDPFAVGIFRSTLLPSIGFHSGLAVVAYAASRATDRLDGKQFLWPAGQVLNAWWFAVGSRVLNENISPGTAYSHLPYTEKLLLTGITAWGARLLYQMSSKVVKKGRDDVRYEEAKREEGFWNKALFSIFLPEALLQAVISLPLTLPFQALDASAYASPLHVHPEYTHGLAVAMFSSGFALQILSDLQATSKDLVSTDDVNREGVWSIVRSPNLLGDTLIHASFPLLLWSSGIMHPLALLGPVANYAFLRYVSGDWNIDSEKDRDQVSDVISTQCNFWPNAEAPTNPWSWAVVGAGVVGLVLEKGVRSYLHG